MGAVSARAAVVSAMLVAAAWLYTRTQDAQAADAAGQGGTDPTAADPAADPGTDGGAISDAIDAVDNFLTPVGWNMSDSNVQAFLMLIRSGESSTGAGAYAMIVGGGTITDFGDHPRIYKRIGQGNTSAAGAYQITATTWDDLRRTYTLPDFTPANQDKAAVALIKRRGALADVIAGRFDAAIAKCRNEWTSLPGAIEARYTLDTARKRLVAYGGTFDGTETVA